MTSTLMVVVVAWTVLYTSVQGEWFGNANQYKCRCSDCPRCSNGCFEGWFGPECQYLDLVKRGSASIAALADDNPDTCAADGQNVSATFVWTNFRFVFTWMRVDTKDLRTLALSVIQFKEQGSKILLPCKNRTQTAIDASVVHIFCNISQTISYIAFSGPGIQHFCSVYVSGGRNVALKANASQTSVREGASAERAVDGNTNSDLDEDSCTHTLTEYKPSLTLTFNKPMWVNRILLYNRDIYKERLQGFQIEFYSMSNEQIGLYRDHSQNEISVYDLNELKIKQPVSRLTVISGVEILTLCELKVQGDTACENGFWGRDCQYNCSCHGKSCFPNNGVCRSGCPAGYRGNGCKEGCFSGYYGDCLTPCNPECPNHICAPVSGNCFKCDIGKYGPSCEGCPEGRFGQDCVFHCSESCKGLQCDPIKGHCLEGCTPGFFGPQCRKKCLHGFYGLECLQNCSGNCMNGSCNVQTGACDLGCRLGYKGQTCDEECPDNHYGPNCSLQCGTYCLGIQNSSYKSGIQLCHPLTGHCLGGCVKPYVGAECKNQPKSSVFILDVFPILQTSIAVGSLALAFIILLSLVMLRKRPAEADKDGTVSAEGFDTETGNTEA